jgi:1,4-alpha-glucan branching enzyme
MAASANVLDRRTTRFVLWSPRPQAAAPVLIIGTLKLGNPPSFEEKGRVPLSPAADLPAGAGLWEVKATDCGLHHNTIYHYWIEVDDSRAPGRVAVTDPFARSVDWRIFPKGATALTQPAAVVRFTKDDQLAECDPHGEVGTFTTPDAPGQLPPNNRLVIYELPTAWTISLAFSQPERAAATFRDVAALADAQLEGANFAELKVLQKGTAYLADLGINALELLPPADSRFNREWGYGTSHYLAPDYELGYPEGNLSPTPNQDLTLLVDALHRQNIRFFVDVVMAFAQEDPYNRIDAADFHIDDPKGTLKANPKDPDPDLRTSRGDGSPRDGFGSTLWRYAKFVTTYDPLSGDVKSISPAAQLMLVYLTRWANEFRVDGLRLDSVENVANWDFVQAFRERGRELFAQRWQAAGLDPGAGGGGDLLSRFLVVGEELSLPFDLLRTKRLDGLWNERFQSRLRAMLLGESTGGDNFEFTVRKAINCLTDGFTDGAQAINYITKHDVEGDRHERLFTMLSFLKPDRKRIEKRIKLGFACLMTAVGIPMFLAGEEFADQHDLFGEGGKVSQNGGKQVDPVNFSRLTAQASDDPNDDPDKFFAATRREIFRYVKILIRLRTTEDALAVNDTDFIWTDFGDGKRVLVWRRGGPNHPRPIIVVANFSDFASAPGTDYVIPTWPATPAGKSWIELTQGQEGTPGRPVNPAFVGREAIFDWEAKLYTLVDA